MRPGAWKVTEDRELIPVRPGESIDQPDWANHASMKGVLYVFRVETEAQATTALTLLEGLGVSENQILRYKQFHQLEETDGR